MSSSSLVKPTKIMQIQMFEISSDSYKDFSSLTKNFSIFHGKLSHFVINNSFYMLQTNKLNSKSWKVKIIKVLYDCLQILNLKDFL